MVRYDRRVIGTIARLQRCIYIVAAVIASADGAVVEMAINTELTSGVHVIG